MLKQKKGRHFPCLNDSEKQADFQGSVAVAGQGSALRTGILGRKSTASH